ncbi:hypothetical protein [Pseudomonas guariconensis]|uniref:hypothetical protein n=1 Tax=Pseudomonas guariconensis TaxID=1288410 RepID=UPI0018AA4109|nr:hypothetical protein [Pseudomonas guariconensis]MBF8720571.1 hypothetical protein [Pseudomonas guariconensis]
MLVRFGRGLYPRLLIAAQGLRQADGAQLRAMLGLERLVRLANHEQGHLPAPYGLSHLITDRIPRSEYQRRGMGKVCALREIDHFGLSPLA